MLRGYRTEENFLRTWLVNVYIYMLGWYLHTSQHTLSTQLQPPAEPLPDLFIACSHAFLMMIFCTRTTVYQRLGTTLIISQTPVSDKTLVNQEIRQGFASAVASRTYPCLQMLFPWLWQRRQNDNNEKCFLGIWGEEGKNCPKTLFLSWEIHVNKVGKLASFIVRVFVIISHAPSSSAANLTGHEW